MLLAIIILAACFILELETSVSHVFIDILAILAIVAAYANLGFPSRRL